VTEVATNLLAPNERAMTSIGAALAGVQLPRNEARPLLALALGVSGTTVIAFPERVLSASEFERYTQLVIRRQSGEPLAYLLGEAEFFGRTFRVSRDVLVPRPETELLVKMTLQAAREIAQPRATAGAISVLDLGTGSGCIAITLALEGPQLRVTGLDCSEAALEIARSNALRLNAPVEFRRGDWLTAVEVEFDLIVANPPYVAELDPHLADLLFEPAVALTAGSDGLAALRTIVADAPRALAGGGRLLVEHGFDQGAAVRALFDAQGYVAIHTTRDDAGHERVCCGTKPG